MLSKAPAAGKGAAGKGARHFCLLPEKVPGTFVGSGFRPRAPVDAFQFADPQVRRAWFEEKGMRVMPLWDPTNPMREVDLFVEPPIDFNLLWEHSEIIHVRGTTIRIASIPDLIDMKRLAGRPEDLLDIEALQEIQRRKGTRR